MRTLFDTPTLMLVGLGTPLLLGGLLLFALYWVVRLAVRHGATDAARDAARDVGSAPGPSGPAGPPEA